METEQNKGKRVLKLVHLNVKILTSSYKVLEYGLDLLKRCLCFARRNSENLFFSEDDCPPTLN